MKSLFETLIKDLALARPVCTFFEAYWQDKFSNNVLPLRVGLDVATIEDVMAVVEMLSSRREYTKLNPFVVLLGKGNHQVTSSWTNPYGNIVVTRLGITCSNITFLGEGKDITTILGGFVIDNLENITFKQMTVTSHRTMRQRNNVSSHSFQLDMESSNASPRAPAASYSPSILRLANNDKHDNSTGSSNGNSNGNNGSSKWNKTS